MSRRGGAVKAPTLDEVAANRSRDSRRKISAGAPHKKERGGDQNSCQAAAPACNASSLCYFSSRQRVGFSLSELLWMCDARKMTLACAWALVRFAIGLRLECGDAVGLTLDRLPFNPLTGH